MKENGPKVNNEDIQQGHYFIQQLSAVAASRYTAARLAITWVDEKTAVS